MTTGPFIDYRLRIHGIPLQWKSEITCWEPPHVFIDEQRQGPYTLWVHEHLFQENEGGTLAMDSVRYAVPGGKLTHELFVKRDIKNIFTYRTEKLKELFTAE
jgi:ligand-binding SRPBCC domain-containing protein